ncbi:recombinase family protein [Lactococcus garvieae]|uniref:recombinase family protein n=1 Tax=Lactococcus garvieae TaxID=1363 RepID=UPI0030D458BF
MKQHVTIDINTLKEERNLTILYARLSKDDGTSRDSDSILNQKLLLETFARDQKMSPCVFLYDDGVSGTSFNRPAFGKAIELVDQGRVKNFIVKDLSRFGRDYLKVGAFTEVAFPEKGVRFVAINDNVDSAKPDDNSLAPFRNLFNEWYARDCSKKIKAVKHAKGKSGIPMTANVPYGYLKGANYLQTHEWVVDEEAAQVIRRIFHSYASGKSMTLIAKELTEEKVLLPSAHKIKLGLKVRAPKYPCYWTSFVVRQVLGRLEYCGHTVNFKTYKNSYKSKQSFYHERKDQRIFKHTHAAIIDEDLFELVQEKRGTYRPRRTRAKKMGLFSGLAHCMDCGYVHHFSQRQDCSSFYYCGGASKRLKTCESRHHIQEKVLAAYVLADIQRLTALVGENESELVAFLEDKHKQEHSHATEVDKQVLQKSEKRHLELDRIIQRLYEDNVNGKVSDARYYKMSRDYEEEQEELMGKIRLLRETLAHKEETDLGIERFVQMARRYLNPTELEPDMVRGLIEKIEIGEKVKIQGQYEQQINIIYRFVGCLTTQLSSN